MDIAVILSMKPKYKEVAMAKCERSIMVAFIIKLVVIISLMAPNLMAEIHRAYIYSHTDGGLYWDPDDPIYFYNGDGLFAYNNAAFDVTFILKDGAGNSLASANIMTGLMWAVTIPTQTRLLCARPKSLKTDQQDECKSALLQGGGTGVPTLSIFSIVITSLLISIIGMYAINKRLKLRSM